MQGYERRIGLECLAQLLGNGHLCVRSLGTLRLAAPELPMRDIRGLPVGGQFAARATWVARPELSGMLDVLDCVGVNLLLMRGCDCSVGPFVYYH